MAANKIIRFGPVAVTNAVTDFLNPGTTTGGVNGGTPQNLFFIVKHIRVVSKVAGLTTISLYIGATGASAAGTEFAWNAASVSGNSFVEWFGQLRLDVGDFMTMVASANTSLVIEAEGEVGVV